MEEKYLNKLHETLPAVKIPSHIVYMKRFPLTANGKLDERVLREICMTKLMLFLNEEMLVKKTRKLMNEKDKKSH